MSEVHTCYASEWSMTLYPFLLYLFAYSCHIVLPKAGRFTASLYSKVPGSVKYFEPNFYDMWKDISVAMFRADNSSDLLASEVCQYCGHLVHNSINDIVYYYHVIFQSVIPLISNILG